jgi:hypothetical protein
MRAAIWLLGAFIDLAREIAAVSTERAQVKRRKF